MKKLILLVSLLNFITSKVVAQYITVTVTLTEINCILGTDEGDGAERIYGRIEVWRPHETFQKKEIFAMFLGQDIDTDKTGSNGGIIWWVGRKNATVLSTGDRKFSFGDQSKKQVIDAKKDDRIIIVGDISEADTKKAKNDDAVNGICDGELHDSTNRLSYKTIYIKDIQNSGNRKEVILCFSQKGTTIQYKVLFEISR